MRILCLLSSRRLEEFRAPHKTVHFWQCDYVQEVRGKKESMYVFNIAARVQFSKWKKPCTKQGIGGKIKMWAHHVCIVDNARSIYECLVVNHWVHKVQPRRQDLAGLRTACFLPDKILKWYAVTHISGNWRNRKGHAYSFLGMGYGHGVFVVVECMCFILPCVHTP